MESMGSIGHKPIPMEKSIFYYERLGIGSPILDEGLESCSDVSIGSIGDEQIPMEKSIFCW